MGTPEGRDKSGPYALCTPACIVEPIFAIIQTSVEALFPVQPAGLQGYSRLFATKGIDCVDMRVQEHVKLSTAMALVALPWLKKDVWIPLTASILIDVDHYLWHAVTHRTLSLRAAVRYFEQADPPRLVQAKLLHHPITLGGLLLLAARTHSRILWLILAGLLFHVGLDAVHVWQMSCLKRSLSEQAHFKCSACGNEYEELQLHTVQVASNLLDRYNPRHFVVLCPTCHEQAHRDSTDDTEYGIIPAKSFG